MVEPPVVLLPLLLLVDELVLRTAMPDGEGAPGEELKRAKKPALMSLLAVLQGGVDVIKQGQARGRTGAGKGVKGAQRL